ncbi:MAG: S-layer protein [Microcoleus sp.]
MVKLKIISAVIILISASCSLPAKAQNSPQIEEQNNSVVQIPPTREQILNACVANRAETLPNPFRDVPSNHWAYKAVLTMYYCGAYREATPPALIKELLESKEVDRTL